MHLKVLDLSNNHLVDSTLQLLGETLSHKKHLKVLFLNGNCTTSVGFSAVLPLGNHIPSNKGKGVSEWGFRHNQLGDDGCDLISRAVPAWAQCGQMNANEILPIASWDLRTNGITEKGCELIAF